MNILATSSRGQSRVWSEQGCELWLVTLKGVSGQDRHAADVGAAAKVVTVLGALRLLQETGWVGV